MSHPTISNWHTLSINETLQQIQTNSQTGLSPLEAQQRLDHYGANALVEAPRPGFWYRFFMQFNNFVIYILLFAIVVSFILGDTVEAIVISAIVILNATLGVIQEGRAEQALAALKKLSAPDARVIRGGKTETIGAESLVPGDLLLLEAGDYIPADLRLIEAFNLKIEEASLTGESVPVDKKADYIVTQDSVLGDRKNMAYMGTIATYGRGKAVVVATGMKTEIGKIADILQSTEEELTPLQQKLNDLGRTLSIAALVICGLIFAIGAGRAISEGRDFVESLQESFIIAISLAIAAVPEGLPAVVTINLAIGMREMIRRNALIRRLPAVETLGSATAICSDKTGTLTQNEMTAVRLHTLSHRLDVTGEGYTVRGEFRENGSSLDPTTYADIKQLLLGGLLDSDARLEAINDNYISTYKMIGDPTEGALVVVAAKANLWRTEIEKTYPRIEEIPFDSDRKRMSTIHQQPTGGYLTFVKGAPDIVVDLCDFIYENNHIIPLDDARRQTVLQLNDEMAGDALRVLAVAESHLQEIPETISSETVEKSLTFVGLIALRDPARPEVAQAIARARLAGIKTTMVTGDYADTARAIAKEIGLLRNGGQVMSGAEIENLSDEALAQKIDEVDAFARVSPHHKVRIVEAFRARNHIVAMTGDGVNDAPALKRASIGVAMGIAGTDVSKESADMILTDDNYNSIVAAIEQGRVIYANIRKFVYFLLSCNLSEISVIFIATLANWSIPLTAIQLLWLNLVTDGAPALALGVEKGDPDIMARPPRDPDEPIINEEMQIGMVIQTIVMTSVTLLAFGIGLGDIRLGALDIPHKGLELARTMAFLVLSAAQLARAYSSRSELFTMFKIGIWSNKYMQYAVLSSVIGLLLVIYVPFLQALFDTVALDLVHWTIVLPLLLFPTVVAELTKPFLRWIKARRPITE